MRKTHDELAFQYPSYAKSLGDRLVPVLYGDEPMHNYNREHYENMKRLTDKDEHLANICAIDQYIYANYGDYLLYKTFAGDIYIKPNGDILAASIGVKYSGKNYDIRLNRMYGHDSFSISYNPYSFDGLYQIWTYGDISYPVPKVYQLMDYDLVMKIVNVKHDYGKSYQSVLDYCKSVLEKDKKNYDKTFHITR